MGEVVISFRVPEALKRELYRAVGEAQARSGEKIELKQVGSMAVALAIAYLREELPAECTKPAAKQLLAAGPVRG
ncbi:MAG: hypothetical protein GSR84_04585 [Desulfurococcales archaeon]|nr:hypothetical protein [Desulfurococcales archaeon]